MTDTSELYNKNCIPCKGGIPSFAISEIHKYLKKIDGWDVKKKKDEIYFLEKNFTFLNTDNHIINLFLNIYAY